MHTPVSGGFQSQGWIPLACVLCHLRTMDSSDSPLVGQLLTSTQPVSLPNHFRSTYLHMYKHWWGSSPGSSVPLFSCNFVLFWHRAVCFVDDCFMIRVLP